MLNLFEASHKLLATAYSLLDPASQGSAYLPMRQLRKGKGMNIFSFRLRSKLAFLK